jgi:hypothetical protein
MAFRGTVGLRLSIFIARKLFSSGVKVISFGASFIGSLKRLIAGLGGCFKVLSFDTLYNRRKLSRRLSGSGLIWARSNDLVFPFRIIGSEYLTSSTSKGAKKPRRFFEIARSSRAHRGHLVTCVSIPISRSFHDESLSSGSESFVEHVRARF